MIEFTKTVFAFLYGPDDVHGGTSYVFDATTQGGYTKLFGQDGEILPTLSNERFEVYAGIWFACCAVKELWREEVRSSKNGGLERRWMFYYTFGRSLDLAYGEDQDLQSQALRRLACRPNWMLQGKDGPVQTVLESHARLAASALTRTYDQAAVVTGFAHRNWFRSQTTLDQIASELKATWKLVSKHKEDYVLPKPK
jgi:hypothetical protein